MYLLRPPADAVSAPRTYRQFSAVVEEGVDTLGVKMSQLLIVNVGSIVPLRKARDGIPRLEGQNHLFIAVVDGFCATIAIEADGHFRPVLGLHRLGTDCARKGQFLPTVIKNRLLHQLGKGGEIHHRCC